jgi:hypothetical protein
MKLTHDDHEKVINTLKTAYHDHDTPEVDGQWQQNVMRDIRRLGPLRPEANGYALYVQYLWRAVPVISMLIIIIAGLVVNLDVMAEYELGNLLIDDPVTTTTIDSFFM